MTKREREENLWGFNLAFLKCRFILTKPEDDNLPIASYLKSLFKKKYLCLMKRPGKNASKFAILLE